MLLHSCPLHHFVDWWWGSVQWWVSLSCVFVSPVSTICGQSAPKGIQVFNQCWVGINFWTYQLVLVLTLFKNFIPAWSGYRGSKADLWLVFGKCIYISGIHIDIALSGIKLISPQVPTRQVREEAGIASGHTSLVSSLIAGLEVLVSITGFDQSSSFQPGRYLPNTGFNLHKLQVFSFLTFMCLLGWRAYQVEVLNLTFNVHTLSS